MRILLALLLALFASTADAAVDLGQYRTATYGTPNHYCSITRSLSTSGTGSLADPWNLTQCQTQPVCGDVIGVMSLTSSLAVDGSGIVQVPVSGAVYNEPAFDPSGITDCTSGNRLVYVAEYPAISLTYSSITSNGNRTEIRTDGVAESADTQNSGRAAMGSYQHDYVTFDGFFFDMAQIGINQDQGILTCRTNTGFTAKNFVIKGTVTDIDSNAVLWRPDACTDDTLSNFRAQDFDNQPTGAGLNQQGLFSDQYGDQNYTIEYFLIDNTDRGIFPKGTAVGGTVFNYGTIRYGIIRNVIGCGLFNDFDASGLTEVHHTLCTTWSQYGWAIDPLTSAPRNLLFHHNTVANGTCPDANSNGPFYIDGYASSGGNLTIRDNIFDYQSTSFCWGIDAGGTAYAFPTTNYNGYYRGGSLVGWSYNGTSYNSAPQATNLSNWRSATSQEANSTVWSSDLFTNRASSIYTVTGAALTASSTGGEIGAYEGSIDPGTDTVDSGGGGGGGSPRFPRIRRFRPGD